MKNKQAEVEYSVSLTEEEWFWLIQHISSWDYLRKKIFHALIEGEHERKVAGK